VRIPRHNNLTLRLPREDEEEEFLLAHRATSPEVPSFLHKAIEKNGGILENVVHGPDLDRPKRCYWIELS
jgi:hypothetical protein